MSDNVHDSEDFINVFLALAILQWTAGDTQLLLTDLYPQVVDPPPPPPPAIGLIHIPSSLYYIYLIILPSLTRQGNISLSGAHSFFTLTLTLTLTLALP